MEIFEQHLGATYQQMRIIQQLSYRPVQAYQGAYSRINYGEHHGRNNVFPDGLKPIADAMAQAVPDQDFNAAFIQRYDVGDFVAPHRDPRTNTGYTLILVLGQFEGAISTIEGYEPFQLKQTDMLKLECTINGKQGPLHSVSPVTEGIRYALILNTIIDYPPSRR